MVSREIELAERARGYGVDLDREQTQLLVHYAGVISDYEKANVVGTRDVGGVLSEHVLDSLTCFLFEPLRDKRRVVDIGSGGGFPGVPLRIINPGLRLTLLDSVGKKVAFLRYALGELQLGGVELVEKRAEEFGREGGGRGGFDVATVRAVGSLAEVLEYSMPLLKVEGNAVIMKSQVSSQEWKRGEAAARELGAGRFYTMPVPGADGRQLVVVEKLFETPEKYPRRVGRPKKQPLGGNRG